MCIFSSLLIAIVVFAMGCSSNGLNSEAPTFEELKKLFEEAPSVLQEYDNSLSYFQVSDTFPFTAVYKGDTLLYLETWQPGCPECLPKVEHGLIQGSDYIYTVHYPSPYGEFHFYKDGEEFFTKKIFGLVEWKDGLYLLSYMDGHIRAHNRAEVIASFNPETREILDLVRDEWY